MTGALENAVSELQEAAVEVRDRVEGAKTRLDAARADQRRIDKALTALNGSASNGHRSGRKKKRKGQTVSEEAVAEVRAAVATIDGEFTSGTVRGLVDYSPPTVTAALARLRDDEFIRVARRTPQGGFVYRRMGRS